MCFPQGPLTKMKKVSGQSSLTLNKQNFGWIRLRIRIAAFPSECLSCHIRIAHLLWYSKADSHAAIDCMPTGVPCLAAPIRRRVPPDQVTARRLSDPSFASRLYQLELSVLNLYALCKPFLFILYKFFVTACEWAINFTGFRSPCTRLSAASVTFFIFTHLLLFFQGSQEAKSKKAAEKGAFAVFDPRRPVFFINNFKYRWFVSQ